MTRKCWLILSGIALAFGIRGAYAGGAWLVITSEPSGATIVVDNAYRGVTPQRSGDGLRIHVSEGPRQINASPRGHVFESFTSVSGGLPVCFGHPLRENSIRLAFPDCELNSPWYPRAQQSYHSQLPDSRPSIRFAQLETPRPLIRNST